MSDQRAKGEQRRLEAVFQKLAEKNRSRPRWDLANRGNRWILDERIAATRRRLEEAGIWPPGDYRILEVGCGTGGELARFGEWSSRTDNLFGIDLVGQRLMEARIAHPSLVLVQGDAAHLQFGDGTFRLVLGVTLLSSIVEPGRQRQVAREIDRVLEPGGRVFWYDFRISSAFNRNTRGIGKRRLRELFPGYVMDLETTTLAPPIARHLGGLTDTLYPILSASGFLRTHYVGTLMKPVVSSRAR